MRASSTPSGSTTTASAAGCSARTTTPSAQACAPRIACGSWWSRETSWSSSAVVTRVGSVIVVLLQQSGDSRNGDRHPVGAVVELVAQFVDRLLEFEDRQQLLGRRSPGGQQRGVDGLHVGLEEG